MSTTQAEIVDIFNQFPTYILRDIIEEYELGTTSNKKEELVSGLSERSWSVDEEEQISQRLSAIKEEDRPLMRYILTIDSESDLGNLVDSMSANSVEFSEENIPVDDGFEIRSAGDSVLEATKWKVTEKEEYIPEINDIRKTTEYNRTDFVVNLSESRLFVESSNYGKATHVRSIVSENGFEFGDIGHRYLQSGQANDLVEEFVNSLRSSRTPLNRVEVSSVKVWIPDISDVRDVEIGGTSDIFTHNDVTHFTDGRGAKIVGLGGHVSYNGSSFDFTVGYTLTSGIGRIKVKKNGEKTGNPEVREEVFGELREIYEEYFVA